MTVPGYLAVDLGAESGRVMLVTLAGGRLGLAEVHRFPNRPVRLPTGLHWDLPALFDAVVDGLRRGVGAAREHGIELRSVGVDAWGVDFGLLGADGALLGPPFCYRDPRHGEASRRALAEVGADAIHAATGIQHLEFNTLFQLVAERDEAPARLAAAARLLFVPDLVHHLLCGSLAVEATIASTSQMVDPRSGDWARGLLARLRIPTAMLGPIVAPGTRLGPLRPEVAARVGAALEVVAPAAHDTASAVAAVPDASGGPFCFLSSGTWSLLGAELREPCFADPTFTNEAGVGGTIRFLKNVSGLWLVQELRSAFAAEGRALDYAELERLAEAAGPAAAVIDPDAPSLREPGAMPAKLRALLRGLGQPAPATPGELVRCCLEGLARRYAELLARLETVLGRRFDRIHVVGGGSRNRLLNRLTAAATGREVAAGPVEATALGNGLVQAIADGAVSDLGAARRLVADFVARAGEA